MFPSFFVPVNESIREEKLNKEEGEKKNHTGIKKHSRQRPLSGDDVVRLAVLVNEPGVGLDPLPPVVLGEQPEDSEAALTRLYHWKDRGHVRASAVCTHSLTNAPLAQQDVLPMLALATCTCYTCCLHTAMQRQSFIFMSSSSSTACARVIEVQLVFLSFLMSKTRARLQNQHKIFLNTFLKTCSETIAVSEK